MTETKTQMIDRLKGSIEELSDSKPEWIAAFQTAILALEADQWLPISDSTPRDQPILVIESDNRQHVVKWREDIRYEETQLSDDSWLTQRVDHGYWEGDNSYYCGWPKFWRPLPAGLEKLS